MGDGNNEERQSLLRNEETRPTTNYYTPFEESGK